MSSVGAYLRALRERRRISLEEVARSTRVLRHYLEALEADDYTVLPAPVFTKGFIRAYCQVLGVAPDEAIALYAERAVASGDDAKTTHVPGTHAAPRSEPQVLAGRRRREGSGRSAVLASFLMLAVLGLSLFAVTFWLQPPREHRSESRPVIPVSGQSVAARTPEAPKAAAPAAAPAAATIPEASGLRPAAAPGPMRLEPAMGLAGITAPYRLVARTSELTWMRVRTEDGRTSEENIPPGETREWVSNRPFVLTIGNAGGVALELNGRRVPRLGQSGAVIERLVLPSKSQ